MKRDPPVAALLVLLGAAVGPLAARAGDTSPAAQLALWQAQAGSPASTERGKAFFTSRQGGDLSCASCHGAPPTAQGRHASTGKLIEPLAQADGVPMPRTALPRYAQECGSCHMAFPPGLLPGASWQRVMAGLDRHFGTDASMDATGVQQVNAWLQANSGTYKRVREEPPKDRITQANGFVRKHDEVAPEVFKRASVKTAANCTACHGGAAQGDFSEHAVRIPK